MRWILILTILLLLIAGACFALWQFGTGRASDFGLNAFTETLGILVTVIVVEALLRRHEQRRLLPVRIAAFEDVSALTNGLVGFWADAYKWTIPTGSPATIEEVLCDAGFKRTAEALSMDSSPVVLPQRTWWDFLPERLRHFRQQAERILERHAFNLDPVAFRLVHVLATDGPDPGILATIRSLDSKNGLPRPRVLGAYWVIPTTYWTALTELLRWCRAERSQLSKATTVEVGIVAGNVTWPADPKPPCRISDEDLGRQVAAMRAWQSARGASSRTP